MGAHHIRLKGKHNLAKSPKFIADVRNCESFILWIISFDNKSVINPRPLWHKKWGGRGDHVMWKVNKSGTLDIHSKSLVTEGIEHGLVA